MTVEHRARVIDAWWDYLKDEPDLGQMFAQPPTSLAALHRLLEGKVVYAMTGEGDDGALTLGPVLWGIPFGHGIQAGLWIPPALRRRPSTLKMIDDLVGLVFKDFPVIIAAAQDKGHQRLYEHYGFIGVIVPHLGTHGDAWLGWLASDSWTRRNGD